MSKNIVKAKDVMTQNFCKMDGMLTVKDAINKMRENDTQIIFVDKRDEHDAFGVVSLSDIANKVLAKDRAPERVNIYEIMTKPIASVPTDMDIRYCARMLENFALSHVPVIDNDEIIGMLGYAELVFQDFSGKYNNA